MKHGKNISPSFHRINYLHQAAFLCMKTTPENLNLCRFYIETIKTIAKKEVLKLTGGSCTIEPVLKDIPFCQKCMFPGFSSQVVSHDSHPYMKRNFCKRCYVLLIPGVSAKLRIRSKRQKHAVITCLECGNIRRYPNIPREKKWFDQVDEDADDKTVQQQMTHQNVKQNSNAGCNSVNPQRRHEQP